MGPPDARGADAVIVFDSGMVDAETPALTLATRGMVFAHVEVRTGTQTAHSGMYGGAALNAFHALHAALGAVLAGPDGRLPEPLRAGVIPPGGGRDRGWATLPTGDGELAGVGARPADAAAATEFYVRTTAEPSLDVHRIEGGQARTIVVPVASADLSVRIVGGQRSDEIARAARAAAARRAARRRGADSSAPSAPRRRPSTRVARAPGGAARDRAACGREPALVPHRRDAARPRRVRRRGIPAIVSGFSLPDDALHAPNESYRVVALEQGARAARALYEELAGLGDRARAALEALRALPKSERRAARAARERRVPRAVGLRASATTTRCCARRRRRTRSTAPRARGAGARGRATASSAGRCSALIGAVRGQRAVCLLRALDRHMARRLHEPRLRGPAGRGSRAGRPARDRLRRRASA